MNNHITSKRNIYKEFNDIDWTLIMVIVQTSTY